MKDLITRILKEQVDLKNLGLEVEPSDRVIKSICDAKKFCKAQGPITFGQLRAIINSAIKERLGKHIGEGGFKATLRLLPWFLPQLAVAGFGAALLRAANKIIKPSLTETQSYKTWWGKTILRLMDVVEGDLPLTDPFSRIFFISDGLMNLMDDDSKIKFARHIAELASKMSDDEPVPDLFVENELRQWINKRFLLDPPLAPKKIEESIVGDRIVCDDCGWAWKIDEGGDDLYMCHQCGHDNTPQNINESKKSPYFRYWDKYGPEIDDDFLWAFGIDSGVPVEVYRELIKYYGGFLKYKKSVDEYIKDKVFEVEPGNRYGGYDFKYKLKLVGEDYSPNSDYDVDNNWTPFTPEYTEIQILPGGSVDLVNHGGEMDLEEAVNDQEFGWEIKHEINDVVNEQQSKEGIFSKFGVYPFDKRIKFI
jgi:hypothetical protein